ncbi:class I histocompatibility antigen, F10 alpha chain-like [Mauremys reevesii]|uniref:class I histocompatibility antigen, F10 alpha chain-like n=1 Tax=Mauremys reevesii TaxID=260615 RepID=UPI00193F8AEA|nr:class I histocompatibility antigen, F10 alpha chain-like [Mauremys reevesii]
MAGARPGQCQRTAAESQQEALQAPSSVQGRGVTWTSTPLLRSQLSYFSRFHSMEAELRWQDPLLAGELRWEDPLLGGHHSLSVLVTGVTHKEGTHHYFMISKLDDVQIAYYSSDTREVRSTQEWAEQALGAEYLQEKTREFWQHEKGSKGDIRRWMQQHNQTGGIHTDQVHVGCALSDQDPMDPKFQCAYDGRDFISFDVQTGTWVAAMQPAFLQKQRWETQKFWTQYVRRYLQSECLGTLQSLVHQGRGVLEQQAPPTVSVSRRDDPDGSVTLSCHTRGFYPRPIHVSWVRDGEDILAEKDSSGILPNADGTYYTESSLEISPQQEDGHRYACRVEHRSLPELVLVWEMADPSENLIFWT